MKKYMIIALCTISTINGMEKQIITREPREWDAKAYDKGNTLQASTFLYFLKTNNIKTENLTILSVGCGTGKIENALAEKAKHIHGFDASKDMIDLAQQNYGHIKNLSFEHRFAEDFQSDKRYQLAIASFCLHWVEEKEQAFQHINDSLELHGELFGTVQTSDNPTPTSLTVAKEMLPSFKEKIAIATGKNLPDLNADTMQPIIGSSYPSHQEFNAMLQKTGFEIIKSEEQSYNCTMSKKELKELYWPVVLSRPFIKPLPTDLQKEFFKEFMTRYIAKLSKTNDNKFFDKHFTTLIHARKIKK